MKRLSFLPLLLALLCLLPVFGSAQADDADNDWTEEESKAYYDYMRNGGDRIKSAQVNAAQYKEASDEDVEV